MNNYNANLENCRGFTYHAQATITVNALKENIANNLCIPIDAIKIVWEDNDEVPGMTLVRNFRDSW